MTTSINSNLLTIFIKILIYILLINFDRLMTLTEMVGINRYIITKYKQTSSFRFELDYFFNNDMLLVKIKNLENQNNLLFQKDE